MKIKFFVTVGLSLAGFLSGCATTNKAATEAGDNATKSDAKATDDKDEYTYYYPTGSWVPVKVKKTSVKPSAQETQDAQDGLSELQRKGMKPNKEASKVFVPGT